MVYTHGPWEPSIDLYLIDRLQAALLVNGVNLDGRYFSFACFFFSSSSSFQVAQRRVSVFVKAVNG